jgi:hypothetical protein
MSIKTGFPYKLYYDEEFNFDGPKVHCRPFSEVSDRMARVRARIDQVKISLDKDGQRNPVVVYIRKNREDCWKLHPGKGRVTAARELGWKTVRALIIDKSGTYDGPGKRITPQRASELFSDDITCVWDADKFCPRLTSGKFSGEPNYSFERRITA